MKKQKLSLEELKVESFVTNQSKVKGGDTPVTFTITLATVSVATISGITEKCTEGCQKYSEAVDCSISA